MVLGAEWRSTNFGSQPVTIFVKFYQIFLPGSLAAPLFRHQNETRSFVFPPTTCGGKAAMAFLSTKLQNSNSNSALSTSLRGSRESCLVLVVRNPWIERATFNRAFWFQVTAHPHNHRDEVGLQETRSPQQVPY